MNAPVTRCPTLVRRVPLAPPLESPAWIEELETWPEQLKQAVREHRAMTKRFNRGRNNRQRTYWGYLTYRSLMVTHGELFCRPQGPFRLVDGEVQEATECQESAPERSALERSDEEIKANTALVRKYRPEFMKRRQPTLPGLEGS